MSELTAAQRTQAQQQIADGPVLLAAMEAEVNEALRLARERATQQIAELDQQIAGLRAQIDIVNHRAADIQTRIAASGAVNIAAARKYLAELQTLLDAEEKP